MKMETRQASRLYRNDELTDFVIRHDARRLKFDSTRLDTHAV